MRLALVALVALFVGAPGVARAFEGPGDTQALPCRPTIACTADLVTPGAFELETGVIYRSLSAGEKQVTDPFLAKVTVAKWLQLQLGSNGYTHESGLVGPTGPATSDYFDNLTPGMKFHVVDQWSYRPSISFSVALSFPTGAETGYPHADDILTTAYVSKDFGPLHADLNAGLDRLSVNTSPVSQPWVALALSTSLPAKLGAMVENYYFAPAAPYASRDAGGLIALNYNPVSWLVIDAGGDIGYVTATRTFSLFAGLTVVPFLLWRSE